jgi:hypothetical protein
VDEVGNSDLGSSNDPNHRYLSLTGIILEVDYDSTVVTPAIEELKSTYFGSNSTENNYPTPQGVDEQKLSIRELARPNY